MAEPNPSDRASVKAEKAILRGHWGDWAEAKRLLPRSSARSIVTYLVDHPADFRGAFARLRRELRMLYFSAYQSHLWNLLLAGWLEANAGPGELVPVDLKVGYVPISPPDAARARPGVESGQPPLAVRPDSAPPGSARRDRRDGPRPVRPGLERPADQAPEGHLLLEGEPALPVLPERAEVRAGRTTRSIPAGRALRLGFGLPKGSYATILVKRITDAAEAAS